METAISKLSFSDLSTKPEGAPWTLWEIFEHLRIAQEDILETYDLHDYEKERGVALQKLAAQIELVLNPPTDNVRQISEAAKG